MKTYVGYRGAKGPVVLVDNGEPWIGLRPLRMREDLRDDSPVGPNWGPGCSGLAQLALALLADATGDDEAAPDLHQEVARNSIQSIRSDCWLMTELEHTGSDTLARRLRVRFHPEPAR